MLRVQNQLWVLTAVLALGFLLPDVLWAQETKYGIDQQTGQDIVDSARSIWGVVSAVALLAGLIGLVIMIFVNKLWGFIVIVIAAIGGFGEKIVAFVMQKGGGAGSQYFNKTSRLLLENDVVSVAQATDLSTTAHAVLTLFG